MSRLDRHIEHPDLGIISTDLFIYDESKPGTGGLATIVIPRELDERVTTFVETDDLEITFHLSRMDNTALVTIKKRSEPRSQDEAAFLLTPEFQFSPKVTVTILFSDWKIVTMIDGKPLKMITEKPRR